MAENPLLPRGEQLRRAVRWIAEHRPCTLRVIEEASLRYDLTPLQAEFLMRYFRDRADDDVESG